MFKHDMILKHNFIANLGQEHNVLFFDRQCTDGVEGGKGEKRRQFMCTAY